LSSAGEYDAADLAGFQGLDGLGDGQIGLARPGGTERHDQVLGVDGVDQFLLAGRLGLDGLHVALVATLIAVVIVMGEWRPGPIGYRQTANFAVILELAGVERAFAQLSLESSLGHQGLHRGKKKGRSRNGSPLVIGRLELERRRRALRPGGSLPICDPGGRTRRSRRDTLYSVQTQGREPKADSRRDAGRCFTLSNRTTKMMLAWFTNG